MNRVHNRLSRDLGLGGAIMMGLGSMIGTGVFVSIGIAAAVIGPAVVLAIVVAVLVATCNALSSAQLAANHPVSGGTYEYGYRCLDPKLGFTAGWMFLCAKSASAATAALGFAGYALPLVGGTPEAMPYVAVGAAALITLLVLGGMRRSSWVNITIVSVTLLALGGFTLFGASTAFANGGPSWTPFFEPRGEPAASAFLYAAALMFVAFTGYGRIATLGEEVREPRRTIPRAIIITLSITAIFYIGVAAVVVGSVGTEPFADAPERQATTLQIAAAAMGSPSLSLLVTIGAITAMLGVLLNLILGLSRVVLAMGRRGDIPPLFGRVSAEGAEPAPAVILVGVLVAALAAIGSVETVWAFSAFTVLIYYAITNLAALRLPKDQRLYPQWIPLVGLANCLFLAFWVPVAIWALGLGLIGAGLAFKSLAPNLWKQPTGDGLGKK